MLKVKTLAATAAVLALTAVPSASQMVGQVGANAGQSPSEARQVDQKFDELRNKGKLDKPAEDELATGADLVKHRKFAEAVPHLEKALAEHPRDVTTLIYIGFAHRMIGDGLKGEAADAEYDKALAYFRKGLSIDRRNRLLHEYAGKIYILKHDQKSAEAEVAVLKRLCPDGCTELSTLSNVLDLYLTNEAVRQSLAPAKQ